MSFSWRLLLVLLLCVKQETELSVPVRQLVFKKDMSEYCRRHVMPSVFVSKQVVEANSQTLHFSRLEVPYSCFITIRTESGSNIILVIQLKSDKSLVQACAENRNQLLVYEIGETFGGYWGPLPEHLIKPEPSKDVRFYTVKTTSAASTIADSAEEENKTSIQAVKQSYEIENQVVTPQTGGNDYIRIELPIVNVSAVLVPVEIESKTGYKFDDSFDVLYDVTPGVGMKFDSSVMPLVQFSIDNMVGRSRDGDLQYRPLYRMDFNEGITPDYRLIFPFESTTFKRKTQRYKYNVNRRLNFKKSKHLFTATDSTSRKKQTTNRRLQYTIQPYNIFTRRYDFIKPPTREENAKIVPNSWELIDDILKNLSKTNKDIKTEKEGRQDSNLLHRISDMDHNISVYLASNLSSYKNYPTSTVPKTRYSMSPITWRLPLVNYKTNIFDQLDDTHKSITTLTDATDTISINTIDSGTSSGIPKFSLDMDSIIIKVAKSDQTDIMKTEKSTVASNVRNGSTAEKLKPLTGSLVDHESWENVVQSAPVMAVKLNQIGLPNATQIDTLPGNEQTSTTKPINSKFRDKRYIYAIPIENARPHRILTSRHREEPATPGYKISDMQEFAELVELQDDELDGRVTLRYLRQYTGPVLYNLCDYSEETRRRVYLFNSSRIVLALNNFTMESMTVVVTPARTLLNTEAHCTSAHLECQVSGARVCIDAMSACDGIPNCGSYDVFDEDRLMCGASEGLQHNVCLAAFTFLAVLLTILYAAHHWLKRCVPKVSDAFFIYSDAAENVLYLDTIMRGPHDIDDGKLYYRSNVFQEETRNQILNQETKSKLIRFLKKSFNCLRCQKAKKVTREELIGDFFKTSPDSNQIYSFAEGEIDEITRKYRSDAAVQTGSSLEMKITKRESIYNFQINLRHDNEKPGTSKGSYNSRDYRRSSGSLSYEESHDELNVLNFLRNARLNSLRSADTCKASSPTKILPQISEEKELQCFDLAECMPSVSSAGLVNVANSSDIHAKSEHARKRLRFDEDTTTIPSASFIEEIYGDGNENNHQRRSTVLGAGKINRSRDSDTVEKSDQDTGSREFKSFFWGGKSKTKKPKKKTQVSLQ